MTPNDLVRLSLKTSGVTGIGQEPDAEDVNDCFTILNAMLGQWNRKRWLIWHLIDVSHVATGALSYTIGSNQDFNTPRPDRIEAAYVRLLPVQSTGPVDLPLEVIEAYEDYARLTVKQIQSFPAAVFYDSSYPFGEVFVYPVPPANQFEVHLILKETLAQFAALTSTINLPPEYTDALIWNLACRIRPLYQLPADPQLVALATTSLNTIRGANSQIPRLTMPAGMSGGYGGRWAGHGIPNYGFTS